MENFREAFLKGNANPEFITAQFADLVRDLMRVVAAGDPAHRRYEACEKIKFIMDLWARCPGSASTPKCLQDAIDQVVVLKPLDDVDLAMIRAARSGVKYLVERSCHDPAAVARASRRGSEFIRDIELIGEAHAGQRRPGR